MKADQPEFTPKHKAGYVAIVGKPNVGKSTLMNTLLQQKISIVTRKPQTTRQRVLGILTTSESQIVFLDTPGLMEPKYLLHEKMLLAARRAVEDANVILVLAEADNASSTLEDLQRLVPSFAKERAVVVCINKIDAVKNDLTPLVKELARTPWIREIIPVSGLKGMNLEAVLQTIVKYLPEHPPFYPPDVVSEHPERFFVAEIIREKIFEQFQEEIPYSAAVEIREFKEREEGKDYVSADIIVERESQKGIIIGKQGAALKNIGQTARRAIEEFVGRPVYLELHVKVGERWREKESWMRRLGYELEQ